MALPHSAGRAEPEMRQLREDVEAAVSAGILKASELPKEIQTVWGLKMREKATMSPRKRDVRESERKIFVRREGSKEYLSTNWPVNPFVFAKWLKHRRRARPKRRVKALQRPVTPRHANSPPQAQKTHSELTDSEKALLLRGGKLPSSKPASPWKF